MRIKVNHDAIAWTMLILLGAQFMLFLVSWIISAAWPEAEVRSLLSSEALRWFMGGFADNIASKPLVWILLLSMAYGIARESHIVDALKKRKMNSYRQTFALRIVLVELIVITFLMAAISMLPHAPLRSVTGQLMPSSFSNSLIPVLAFTIFIMAATYALLTGVMRKPADVLKALAKGIGDAGVIIVAYVVVAELILSFFYVFRISFG